MPRQVGEPAVGAEAVAPFITGILVAALVPPWGQYMIIAALLPLALFGKPADRRIIQPTMIPPRRRVINADTVVRAYARAGLCDPAKEGMKLGFAGRMTRDKHDKGSLVPVAMRGKTFEQAQPRHYFCMRAAVPSGPRAGM